MSATDIRAALASALDLPRVYVAGPMSGIAEYNFPAFHCLSTELRVEGYPVVNPAELALDAGPPGSQPWDFYMRVDLAALLECDAVCVLPGWERSKGASLEVHVARALEMPVFQRRAGQMVELKTPEQVWLEAMAAQWVQAWCAAVCGVYWERWCELPGEL